MSRVHQSRINYIDNLDTVLSVREDFKKLEYKRSNDGREYMFMHLITGDVKYFEITGLSEQYIFYIIAKITCGIVPEELITDNEKRLEIGKLFN